MWEALYCRQLSYSITLAKQIYMERAIIQFENVTCALRAATCKINPFLNYELLFDICKGPRSIWVMLGKYLRAPGFIQRTKILKRQETQSNHRGSCVL